MQNKKVGIGDFKLNKEMREIINKILDSNWITEGKFTKLFEEEFAKYIGCKHCIAVNSGTSAIMVAITAFRYKYNLEYMSGITTALTFPATLNSMILCGCQSHLCDVNKDFLIDVNQLSMMNRADIIIPVHLFGYPCDMDSIMKIAARWNAFVIEDCCESVGTYYKEKRTGNIGHVGCHSFFVSHLLIGGELGAITTNDDEIATLCRRVKNHGRVGSNMNFNHHYVGFNMKTTDFSTGLVSTQIKYADEIIRQRANNVLFFNENIKHPRLILPRYEPTVSYLGYPLIAQTIEDKQKIISSLNENGIETRGMFPCLTNQVAFSQYGFGTFPKAGEIEKHGFYIPIHQLMSQEDKELIIKTINECH